MFSVIITLIICGTAIVITFRITDRGFTLYRYATTRIKTNETTAATTKPVPEVPDDAQNVCTGMIESLNSFLDDDKEVNK